MAHVKRFGLLAVLLLTAITAPLAARPQSAHAGGDWFAYLFNNESKDIVRVHLSGQMDMVPVGFNEDEAFGANDMTFSPDGSIMAYCAFTGMPDGSQKTALTIWSLSNADNTASMLYKIELGSPVGCRVGHPGIDQDNTMLAVGLVNYFPGDPNADTTLPPWSLQVFDLATGSLKYEMNPSTPGFVQTPGFDNLVLMPDVRHFADNQIVFAQMPWGIGGPGMELPAYTWDLTTGGIAQLNHWGALAYDTLTQTGELAWIELDSSRPAAEPAGPMAQANIVKVADADATPRTVFYTGDWIISDVKFIDGGKRLAVQLIAPFDPAAPPEQGSEIRWVAVDRNGQVTGLETNLFVFTKVDYGPEGYLFFSQSYTDPANYTGSSFSLQYVMEDGTRSVLWQAEGNSWEYAWSMDWPMNLDLTPFPAIP